MTLFNKPEDGSVSLAGVSATIGSSTDFCLILVERLAPGSNALTLIFNPLLIASLPIKFERKLTIFIRNIYDECVQNRSHDG